MKMKKQVTSIFLVLLLTIVFAIPVQAANTETKYGKHTNCSDNYFATDGQYFYYSVRGNVDREGNEINTLVRETISNGKKKTLYTAKNNIASNINVIGGCIYFTANAEGNIYRMNTDGTGLACIYTARQPGSNAYSDGIMDMIIVDNTIFALCDDGIMGKDARLMSMNLDGNNPKLLCGTRAMSITVYEHEIFMLYRNTITCYSIDNDTIRSFTLDNVQSSNNTSLQASSDGRLYYFHYKASSGYDFAATYSLNRDGSDLRREATTYGKFIISKDDIFYYNESDGNIYRTKLNGSSTPTNISNGKTSNAFNYHNGYIYIYGYYMNNGKEYRADRSIKVS